MVRKCRCLTDLLINVHSGCYLTDMLIYHDKKKTKKLQHRWRSVLICCLYVSVNNALTLDTLELTGLHVQPLSFEIIQLIFRCVWPISACWVFQPFLLLHLATQWCADSLFYALVELSKDKSMSVIESLVGWKCFVFEIFFIYVFIAKSFLSPTWVFVIFSRLYIYI